MVRPFVIKVISVSLIAVVSGCAAPQSLEMSRASTAIHVPQPAAVSALSRKFRAETPYIVNFGFDSDRLDASAMAELGIQADWIIAHPHVKFRVYGHTDRVGNQAYNEALGLRRAERVVAFFMSRGISENRLEAMASFGEDLPLIDIDAPERMNRRTMTDVIGFIIPREDSGDGDATVRVETRIERDVLPSREEYPGDDGPEEEGPQDDGPNDDGPQDDGPNDEGPEGGQNPNAGRGNGDEGGDPGNSEGKNKGGDELT